MSDLDDLASASSGTEPPARPGKPGRPAAAAGAEKSAKAGKSAPARAKPAGRQLQPGEMPGPSTAVIISLAVVGVLLVGGAIFIATRAGKSGGNATNAPPQAGDTRANRAAPATSPTTAPSSTQATAARPKPRPAVVAPKLPKKPAPPPPEENFASAKDAVEVSAKVLAGDNVRVEMRNKSGKWIKGLLVYGFTKEDDTIDVGQFGSEWLRPRQKIGGDVEWPGISNLLRPGEEVPRLVIQEAEFADPPKAAPRPPAAKPSPDAADEAADPQNAGS